MFFISWIFIVASSLFGIIRDLDCVVSFDTQYCFIQDRKMERMIGVGEVHKFVYHLKTTLVAQKSSSNISHFRLGQTSHPSLFFFIILFQVLWSLNNSHYDVCYWANQHRKFFPKTSTVFPEAASPVSWVYCYVSVRNNTPSHFGAHYFLTLVDDFSHATWLYLMADKYDVYHYLTAFFATTKAQFSCCQHILSDLGADFASSQLQHIFVLTASSIRVLGLNKMGECNVSIAIY